jgi:hypothetical protein
MSDEPKDLKREVTDVVERRDQSRNYMRSNYYDEWTEVFQAIKCRTSPITRKDSTGKEVEDKSRTNVAMPDLNLIFRRNTARLTASPYQLNYTGGDPMIAEMLTALSAQQYDRSGEAIADRRVVMCAEAFGVGYSKLYWDSIAPMRRFRRAFMRGDKVVFRDRASVMRAQGAPEEEIKQALDTLGAEMRDDEIAQAMLRSGKEIVVPQEVRKYEGPCVKSVFPGDLFIEPGVLCLEDSAFVVEQYTETDLWLQKMAKLTYKDENGQEVRAFDPKACQELLDANPGAEEPDSKINDLKQMFRGILAQTTPRPMEKRLLPNKRFDILEYHALEDDGRMWIKWCSDKYRDRPLGKMPYPWDFYGQFAFNEFVPLPDIISAIGDSTPRLLRYVYLLKNLTVAQNFDYITQLLRLFMLRERGVSIEDDATERGLFRELEVSKLSGIQVQQVPPLPSGAFERTAYLRSEMAVAEPSINQVESGTSLSPMAAKTATTAMLASKAADALTQFKIDGRNLYLKALGQKKLWMNQQAADADEPWQIQQSYMTHALREAQTSGELKDWAESRESSLEDWMLSSRNGKTCAIRLDPMEIQEDYQVEPEAGSYLAVDDDLRQQAAMRVQAVASANPGIVDQRKLARFQLSTIRGIGNPDDYILPERPPEANMQPKVGVNISIALEKQRPEVQAQLLKMAGIQVNPADVQAESMVNGIQKLSEGADAVSNLLSTDEPQAQEAALPAAANA